MGLFSTLASTTVGGSSNIKDSTAANESATASSLSVPTVVQLYTGDKPILLEDTSTVLGYTALTYQAVQVGAMGGDYPTLDEVKNPSLGAAMIQRHPNPDLGVWNCRVYRQESPTLTGPESGGGGIGGGNGSAPLVDSLLAKIADGATTYVWTVHLADVTNVEPTVALLKAALVRHLLDHPPPKEAKSASSGNDPALVNDDDVDDDDDATMDATWNQSKSRTNTNATNTRTTSLFHLQATPFGLASEDKATENTIDESTKEIRVRLMICAVVPSPEGGEDRGDRHMDGETAYRQQQARALVVYHLRKFAYAIRASLCFVEEPPIDSVPDIVPSLSATSPTKESAAAAAVEAASSAAAPNTSDNIQPALPYAKLAQVWRDLALGIPVWQVDAGMVDIQPSASINDDDDENVVAVTTTALYGPGRYQEDLIESVLLRNASYPGHWDANRDSLWVALPTPTDDPSQTVTGSSAASTSRTGDDGWLNQLRDSIASAMPPAVPSATNATADGSNTGSGGGNDGQQGGGKTPKEKDAAVSSFFESLLKNP